MYSKLTRKLSESGIAYQMNEPIAPFTTFRIGGLADVLCKIEDLTKLVECVECCKKCDIPFKILGGGSNVLVSDKGFRGVVIINKSKGWELVEENTQASVMNNTLHRHQSNDAIEPLKNGQKKVIIRVASGMKVTSLMTALFKEDISGLELFSGIPASVGGAVYMNMHGGSLFFGDLLLSAQILREGDILNVPNSYFEFDYDYSILHNTKDIVLSCELLLTKGQSEEAKALAKEWVQRKKIQPVRSAGCIFHNLTDEEQNKLQLPTPSTGYVIEKLLKMKGRTIGGAMISNTHAAFITNIGNAKASEVLELINEIKKEALLQLGLQLVSEIEFVGEMS